MVFETLIGLIVLESWILVVSDHRTIQQCDNLAINSVFH